MNDSFNTSQREAKLKAYFDRLTNLNLSGLVNEIEENKNQLRLSDNDVKKLSSLKKTEVPDEKPTQPTTKPKSKEELKAEAKEKLLTGEKPSEAEIKVLRLQQMPIPRLSSRSFVCSLPPLWRCLVLSTLRQIQNTLNWIFFTTHR